MLVQTLGKPKPVSLINEHALLTGQHSLTNHDHTPCEADKRQEWSRSNFSAHDSSRRLKEHIGNEEDERDG